MRQRKSRGFNWYLITLASLGVVLCVQVAALVHRRAAPLPKLATLRPGDALPDLSLDRIVASSSGRQEVERGPRLSDFVRTGCAIVLFFESTCPACERIAPSWSNRRSIVIDGIALPVHWVTVHRTDAGALRFAQRHGLPQPVYAVRSAADLSALGVNSWPRAYAIAGRGVYAGSLRILPEEITALPPRCFRETE